LQYDGDPGVHWVGNCDEFSAVSGPIFRKFSGEYNSLLIVSLPFVCSAFRSEDVVVKQLKTQIAIATFSSFLLVVF